MKWPIKNHIWSNKQILLTYFFLHSLRFIPFSFFSINHRMKRADVWLIHTFNRLIALVKNEIVNSKRLNLLREQFFGLIPRLCTILDFSFSFLVRHVNGSPIFRSNFCCLFSKTSRIVGLVITSFFRFCFFFFIHLLWRLFLTTLSLLIKV